MTVKSNLLQRAYSVETSEDVKALYRDWAQTYDEDLLGDDLDYVAPFEALKVFTKHFEDLSARIIDVGCGTGLSGVALTKAGFEQIDGLDLSPDMLKVAASKNIYDTLFEGDLCAGLPLDDNLYEAVFSVGTFTHGHVGPNGLKEVLRIAKPGAIVCLTVNEGVYEKLEYPSELDQLAMDGLCKVIEIIETDYLRAEGIRSKVLCLKAQ